MATAKEIWETLSQIDVSEHIEEKGDRKLSYLSWSWAWATLMGAYPQATYEFREFARGDGTLTDILQYPHHDTASVHCTVTIDDVSRSMWLPVMDYRNNAIAAPDARAISDTKMRCLVKCLAMHGLGLMLYQDFSDLPDPEKTNQPKKAKKETQKRESDKKVAKKEVTIEDGILNTFTTFSEGGDQTEKLRDFWKANAGELKKLEKSHPDAYARILKMFSEKKKELEKNEEEEMNL